MNPGAIKRFRFEAADHANELKPLGIMKWNEVRDEKFAELIIQECVRLVLNGKHDNEKFDINDKFHCGHNIALENASEGIVKHFGVEK